MTVKLDSSLLTFWSLFDDVFWVVFIKAHAKVFFENFALTSGGERSH